MAESIEHEQSDLNTFQEGASSKEVEKETMDIEGVDNDLEYTLASIAYDIEEDIAEIQAEAILAAAKSIGNANNSSSVKPSNLEIEAALNSTFVTGIEESTSSEIVDLTSLSECKLAAHFAEKASDNARRVVSMGQDLMETISSTIQVLQSHVRAFSEKAVEAGERGTERGYRVSDFYHTMASKYEATVAALEKKARNVEVALSKVEDAGKQSLKFGELCEEIIDETLDESIRTKFSACWWTNKGRAAIIVCLKKERAVLLMMRRIWISVRNDMEYEERNRTAEDSDEETQQCENRDRKTKIGHIVTTFLGLSLLSVTSLFQVGSDSFNAILALGLLTTGWCAVYWSHRIYKCLKAHDREESDIETDDREDRDGFLENCDRRLEIVVNHLAKYNVIIDSDTESDTGSSETVRIDDIPA